MKKLSRSHHGSLNELNITPLLDLVFVLLVIFIITTPQMSNDLELNLPSPKKASQPSQPPKLHYLDVTREGEVTLDRNPVLLTELKEQLLSMKRTDPEVSVVLRGSIQAEYQKVVRVLDLLQQAEIERVGLATEGIPGDAPRTP